MQLPTSHSTRSAYHAAAANQLELDAQTHPKTHLAEACYRSAISRAYYAAYHHVLDIAVNQSNPSARFNDDLRLGSIHDRLVPWLKNYLAGKIYGQNLFICKSLRHAADYKDKLQHNDSANPSRNMGPYAPAEAYMYISSLAKGIIDNVR